MIQSYVRRWVTNKTVNNTLTIQGGVVLNHKAARQKTTRAIVNGNPTKGGIAEVHGVKIQVNRWQKAVSYRIPQTMLMPWTQAARISGTHRKGARGYSR